MAKEPSLKTFPIDRLVKEAYRVLMILHKYDGLRWNNSLLIWNIFISSFKEDIVLAKLFETFGSDILASFTELYCQGTDTFAFTLE